jgi:flagellar hook-basal body protein
MFADGLGGGVGYNSGSVTSKVRYTISDQGPIAYTTSSTDLAISGNGFFVVSDPSGSPYLTRAGNFVVDGRSGNLINASGFTLMGYSLANGPANPALNSLDGVVPVNMSNFGMQAAGSTAGTFTGNLPYGKPPVIVSGSAHTAVPGVPGSASIEVSNLSDEDSISINDGSGSITLDVTTETTVDDVIASIDAAISAGTLKDIQASKDPDTGNLVVTSLDKTGNTNVEISVSDTRKGIEHPGTTTPAVSGAVELNVADLEFGSYIVFDSGTGPQPFMVTAESSVDDFVASITAAIDAGSLKGVKASKDSDSGNLLLTSLDATGGTNVTGSVHRDYKGTPTAAIPAEPGYVEIPVSNLTPHDVIKFTVEGGSEQVFTVTTETTVDDLITSINDGIGPLSDVNASKDSSGNLVLTSLEPTGNTDVSGTFTDIARASKQSSLQGFDSVGNPVKLDIQLEKTGIDAWDITIYNGSTLLEGPTTMLFDDSGQLIGPSTLNFDIPKGKNFTLDQTGMTQLAGDYTVTGSSNGNAPSAVKDAEFASDGTVYAVYEDGTRVAAYKVPLATVASPDNLSPRAGNVYETTSQSSGYQVGFPESIGFGSLASGALEGSNVDIGTELTAMIEAQTSYTANSKVFQTNRL